MWPAKKHKYGAKPVDWNGMHFDSTREYQRYRELLLLEKAGKISNLQRQVRYTLIPEQMLKNGRKMRPIEYIADHVYIENGELVVEDVKGYITEEFRLKEKLMKWTHNIELKKVK